MNDEQLGIAKCVWVKVNCQNRVKRMGAPPCDLAEFATQIRGLFPQDSLGAWQSDNTESEGFTIWWYGATRVDFSQKHCSQNAVQVTT